jgi:hypothetical protein
MNISDIEIRKTLEIIHILKDNWTYENYIKEYWKPDRFNTRNKILVLELHTGGDSNNEDLIKQLDNHQLWNLHWWWKTERGGHYYYEIDFTKIGYLPMSEFINKYNVSKQYIHKYPAKYEIINITEKKRLIRQKTKWVK